MHLRFADADRSAAWTAHPSGAVPQADVDMIAIRLRRLERRLDRLWLDAAVAFCAGLLLGAVVMAAVLLAGGM